VVSRVQGPTKKEGRQGGPFRAGMSCDVADGDIRSWKAFGRQNYARPELCGRVRR
jgi:hypothetical protein